MNQLRNTLDNARNWWDDLDFSPLQRKSLLVLALVIVASSGFLVLHGTSEEIVQVAPPQIEMPTVTTHLMVDVAGAVLKPGVYALPMNARVIDAITAAGNVLKGADVSDINLARILKDGEQVYVYPPSRSGDRLDLRYEMHQLEIQDLSFSIALVRKNWKHSMESAPCSPLASLLIAMQMGPLILWKRSLKSRESGQLSSRNLKRRFVSESSFI
jgi:DNA uptake protein ComE-like DNA-binding protein